MMTRWKAAGIHLAISLVVIALVGAGLMFLWYGWPLFKLMGGARLLLVLAAVDLVAGPLLTLIVFKSGKPSLRFDLTVIALLQAGFLAYGLYIMAISRPVFLVALVDRFELVFANELADTDLAQGERPEFSTRSWTGPRLVGGKLGATSQERYDLTMSGLAGKDIHLLPRQYTDYDTVKAALLAKAAPAEQLAATSPEARAALEAAARRVDRPLSALATLPITSRRARATMLIDSTTGDVLAPVSVDPWPDVAALQHGRAAGSDESRQ